MSLDFEKSNYSPGETVSAKVKIQTQGGEQIPNGSSISFRVEFGDSVLMPVFEAEDILLNPQGEANITFSIPTDT